MLINEDPGSILVDIQNTGSSNGKQWEVMNILVLGVAKCKINIGVVDSFDGVRLDDIKIL